MHPTWPRSVTRERMRWRSSVAYIPHQARSGKIIVVSWRQPARLPQSEQLFRIRNQHGITSKWPARDGDLLTVQRKCKIIDDFGREFGDSFWLLAVDRQHPEI